MIQQLAQKMDWDNTVPIFYKHLHNLIVNRTNKRLNHIPINQDIIERSDLCSFLYDYKIPKYLVPDIIKEMEYYKLLETINQRKIKIN